MSHDRQHDDSRNQTTRRTFIRSAGAVTAAVTLGAPSGRVLGANERIGIGLIGCGGRGRSHLSLLKKMKESANIEIVAVADVYRPRMKKTADEYKAKGYMDHKELLADAAVNVVCIATPDHIHGYQALDAVKAGKDVYCEKPVTHWRQFDLTKQLSVDIPKSGRVFQLGTQGMSDGAWHQARKLIQEGLIGQPIHAECGYFRVGDWGERGMPVDDPNAKEGPDLNWKAFLGDSPDRPFDVSRFFRWRMYEDYSGGPATDLFPHSLTPVVSMLGVKWPSMVVASGGKFRYQEREVPDTFNMLIDYPEKITVAVLGTQGNNYAGYGYRGAGSRCPTIRGWDGTLTFEGKEIVFTPAQESKKQSKRFPIEYNESQQQFWTDLLTCCRSRNVQTRSTIDLAYYTQTALHMGVLGLRSGKAATFDPAAQKIVV